MPSKVSLGPVGSRSLKWGLIFASPFLVGFVAFRVYPILASLHFSFTQYDIFSSPEWLGLANYRELFADPFFWRSIYNTLIFTVFAVPLGMITALALALLLNTKIRGQAVYRTVFFLPSIVPIVATTILWFWIFNAEYGLLNAFLRPGFGVLSEWLGKSVSPPGWLSDPSMAKASLVIMGLWGVGGSVVIYLAALQDVPASLYESAEIDGANAWSKFRYVTLPLISPVLFFTLVMGLIGTLQYFTQAFIMTAGGPANATLFYCLYLFKNAFTYFRLGYASAMAWILFVLIVVITIAVFRFGGKAVFYHGR